MVMEPEAPEMVTPEPWVSVARVKPEPLPIKECRWERWKCRDRCRRGKLRVGFPRLQWRCRSSK